MQNAEIAEKSFTNSKKFKEFILPSGNIVKLQGYEDIVLKQLLNIYNENQIKCTRKDVLEKMY
jgi:hypothetical protein